MTKVKQKGSFWKLLTFTDVNEFDKMASTFAEKNKEFAKSTKDINAQSGSKQKQSPFQGMYYGKVGCGVSRST